MKEKIFISVIVLVMVFLAVLILTDNTRVTKAQAQVLPFTMPTPTKQQLDQAGLAAPCISVKMMRKGETCRHCIKDKVGTEWMLNECEGVPVREQQ